MEYCHVADDCVRFAVQRYVHVDSQREQKTLANGAPVKGRKDSGQAERRERRLNGSQTSRIVPPRL